VKSAFKLEIRKLSLFGNLNARIALTTGSILLIFTDLSISFMSNAGAFPSYSVVILLPVMVFTIYLLLLAYFEISVAVNVARCLKVEDVSTMVTARNLMLKHKNNNKIASEPPKVSSSSAAKNNKVSTSTQAAAAGQDKKGVNNLKVLSELELMKMDMFIRLQQVSRHILAAGCAKLLIVLLLIMAGLRVDRLHIAIYFFTWASPSILGQTVCTFTNMAIRVSLKKTEI
jgi:hypothetical protein